MRVVSPKRGMAVVCAAASLFLSSTARAATIAVPAGGDLQAALNAAQPGDVVTLAPGATYVGNFVLPNKGPIAAPITVRSAASDALLPRAGVRMTPAYASLLPKIKSPNSTSALRTAAAANHWTLLFLEFQANLNGYGDIVALGAGDSTQTDLSKVPYALVVDRVYVHGDPELGQKRGIALHSRDTSIVNSYISDCKAIGQDSQAIGGFNGPGNYLIENNYLEGAAENVLMGGADPTIPNLVTTNITFRHNHLSKPLAWRGAIIATPSTAAATPVPSGGSLTAGTYSYKVVARRAAGQTNKANSVPTAEVSATLSVPGAVTITWSAVADADDYVVYGRTPGGENIYWKTTGLFFTDTGAPGTSGTPSSKGSKWAVKNVFELKNAQDVLVEGNVIENLWVADQPGYPVVFTPRNQSGSAPWTVVQRVVFRRNLVRHTAGGVNILGWDNINPSQRTNHIAIEQNLFDDMTSAAWGTGARFVQLGDGPDAITIDHNTVIATTSTIVWLYGGSATSPTPITNVRYTNNMSPHNTYGIFGSNFSSGLSSINAYMPDAVVARNVLAGGSAAKYPADNFFPTVTAWRGDFADYASGDYHLTASSALKGAGTDGADLGADIDAIAAEAAIALGGDNTLPPGATPVQILTTALPNGAYGVPYAQTLSCAGGSGACAWNVQDSSLPSGLWFDPGTAAVSGTPTTVGAGTLTVQAFDPLWPANATVKTFSLNVDAPPFAIDIPSSSSGRVGAAFDLTASATGALGAVTWTIQSGALPAGLVLDAVSGRISGVPTAWGTWTAVVQGADAYAPGRVDAKAVTIAIDPAPLSVAGGRLPDGAYNVGYSVALQATGGTGSATWAVTAGALPPGLSLSAAGALTGVPTMAGLFQFDVEAIDASWTNYHALAAFSIEVLAPTLTLSIPSVPSGQVGQSYQLAPVVSGAMGLVAWSLASGSLPPGVVLNAATGLVSGTPTGSGTFTSTIRVADISRVATAPVTISIASAPQASAANPEIVLYASKATTIVGAWSRLADGTAAGGYRLANPNAGAAKLTTPLAAPVSYFELTFQADARAPYHLWIRGKAEGNSWANDSVYVQFSGTVDAAGNAVHRIGTTSAATVSIEDGLNAGLSGWGWQDDAYGSLAGPLYFETSGSQTIRIQVREDGLSIDQIVLSAATYAAVAPGTTKNDTTILAETALGGSTVSASAVTVDTREIVLYASAATTLAGTWSKVDDASAAAGVRLGTADLGAAKVSVSANPANYFELRFKAEAGVPYHLWIRGKAQGNSWANDSAFVQFSQSMDASGAAVARIGTTSAATVTLEDALNAGVSGWGWQDNGYASLAAPIYFAQSGDQTMRIQVREDGLSIDQIVLSSGNYLASAPGTLKNDATILVRTQ